MDNYDKLERLADLKSKKIISDGEFAKHKDVLLAVAIDDEQKCLNNKKNGVIYVLLAWFLGLLGIHNFYAGFNVKGIVQMVLSLFSWLLFFFPLIAVGVWAFVEMLVVNKDADGCEFSGNKRLITALRIIAVVFAATTFLGLFGMISYMYVPLPITVVVPPVA